MEENRQPLSSMAIEKKVQLLRNKHMLFLAFFFHFVLLRYD